MSAWRVEPNISVGQTFLTDPASWLAPEMRQRNLRYLLAYADDGVIWGRLDDDGLHLSHKFAPDVSPELRAVTLRECRMFEALGELLLWREDADWRGRFVSDDGSVGT